MEPKVRVQDVHEEGFLITIDEVQKIKQDDLVRIGNAVQGAKNLGKPVSPVVSGLPNSYNRIRRFSGGIPTSSSSSVA